LPLVGVGATLGCIAGLALGIQASNVAENRRLIGGTTRKQKRKEKRKSFRRGRKY
jgi:hypothetical protein